MRAALAICIGLTVLAGCQSDKPVIRTDSSERLPSNMYVTLPRLAQRLALSYFGEEDGLIELSAPPDHVMLVEESRQAIVNGRKVALDYPCMRRGDEFVIRADDANRMGKVLADLRTQRTKRTAPPVVLPVTPTQRPFPAVWQPHASPRAWRYIVIHHQAAARGSAALIDRAHKQRGMDGLGYHFVVGNGSATGNGEIEVGYRWKIQTHGAHARAHAGDDNRWNEYGIGICLVGDFTSVEPSAGQMDSLVHLVRALMDRYHVPAGRVVPHGFIKETACPGARFPWDEFQRKLR